MQDRFTSRDVIALTGFRARQLQWWDQCGVVILGRERHRRLYTTEHLSEAAAICESRRKGFSLQGVRKAMPFLDRERRQMPDEVVARNSEYHRLGDATHLYLESPARVIVDVLKNSNQPLLGIALADAARQVRTGNASGKANTSVTSPDYPKRARKASWEEVRTGRTRTKLGGTHGR